MSNILFPPAGAHPAAYSLAPAIPTRQHNPQTVAPAARSGASDFGFSPETGHGRAAQPRRADKGENRSPPPTVLQLKIDSMLREQAEALKKEAAARAAETARADRAEAKLAAVEARLPAPEIAVPADKPASDTAIRQADTPQAQQQRAQGQASVQTSEPTPPPDDKSDRNSVFRTLP